MEGDSPDTQPMFFSTSSSEAESFTSAPASARQYISMMSLMRVNSTLDESASSTASEWADSILKKANPPSGFCFRMRAPSSNHFSICGMLMFSSANGADLMNSGTEGGDSVSNASAMLRTWEWSSVSSWLSACDVSSMTAGIFDPPFFTSCSASCRKRSRWSGSILGSALVPASKKLFTSRQPVSVSVDASEMKASLSSPISGKSCWPRVMHSEARS